MGEFDQALAILRSISGNDNTMFIAKLMAERAMQCDPCVFVLTQNKNDALRHAQTDDPLYVYIPEKDIDIEDRPKSLWIRIKEKILHSGEELEFD